MPASQKDVIYVDVDDEITAIIEKLQASSGKIVAFVLPKRATVFQSIVNMKLLKRTAESTKKNLVLITSEKSLMPLAGAVGVHVASTLQSKPVIPEAPKQSDMPVSVDEIEVGEAEESRPPATNRATIAPLPVPIDDDEETIEVGDEPTKPSKKAAAAGGAKSFNKKLKVPDFNKFRNKLILGAGLLVLLIILFIVGNVVLPHATVHVKTNNAEIAESVDVVSSPDIKEVSAESGRVPGAIKEYKKTEIQKAAATGQKDMGTKATGSTTFTTKVSCNVTQPNALPAGTTITSGNFSFVTQQAASFTFTGDIDGTPPNVKCTWKTAKVDVVASKAGDGYNLSARDYAVSGKSGITAKGSDMEGGTSKLVKVVSQQDIDNLKNKIVESVSATANEETKKLLQDENYFALTDSFTTKDPVVTSNPGVDAEAEEVTVSVTLSYTMAGASKEGLEEVLKVALEKKINPDQQKILDNGLSSAGIRINSKNDKGEVSFQLDVKATAGVEQNQDDIKDAIAGKKKNEAEQIIRAREGIEDVTVSYSPFWVSKVPNNVNKIEIVFDQETTNE
jgi:hypothetical protein